MVAAGFAGAVSSGTNATWPLFTFGMVAFLPVIHAIAVSFAAAAKARGPVTAALYNKLAILLVVTWSAYPLIWATGEGGQVSSVDAETIAYAFFDIVRLSRKTPRPPAAPAPATLTTLAPTPTRAPRPQNQQTAKCVFGVILIAGHAATAAEAHPEKALTAAASPA
jgi:hypothetical protein